jgi:hypothetical protein
VARLAAGGEVASEGCVQLLLSVLPFSRLCSDFASDDHARIIPVTYNRGSCINPVDYHLILLMKLTAKIE